MGAAAAATCVAFVFLLSGPTAAAPRTISAAPTADGYGDFDDTYGPTLHRGSRGFALAMHQAS